MGAPQGSMPQTSSDPKFGMNPQATNEMLHEMSDDFRVEPDVMLALAQKAAELVVERTVRLPLENSWDGEFRQGLENRLKEDPPEDGRPAEDVLQRAAEDILSFAARLDHPRFFGFIPSSPLWPAVLAEFMSSGYNINQCTWLVASGPSQCELVVVDWIRQWLGYPEKAGGLFTSGGSAASLEALVAAREAAGYPERATIYMSDQSHGSLIRAARISGIRAECIRIIESNESFRMDVEALKRAVEVDRANGFNPIAVVATAGTGSTGTIDPMDAMADFCESENIWLHVDAAYGGFAVITEEGKELLHGIHRADSIGMDAHKWFFQPYEAGCLMVKDVSTLENVFAMRNDILQDTIWGKAHPNFADRGMQLSRAARSLKVWMSIQTFGMGAFRRAVLRGMQLAMRAEQYCRQSTILEPLNPASLGIVCFRVNPANVELDENALEKINSAVLAHIFWEDRAFVSSTLLRKTFALRFCILNHNTTWNDVRETLEAIERFGISELPK